VPIAQRDDWTRTFMSVNANTHSGIVASTLAMRQRYWRHWCALLPPSVDPHLQGVDPAENLHSYTFSLNESGKVQLAQDAKSNLVAYRQPSAPLARPSNWMGAATRFTSQEPPTTMLDLRHK